MCFTKSKISLFPQEAFVELLKELKEQFADKNFALSIAVGVTQTTVDLSYSVVEINE